MVVNTPPAQGRASQVNFLLRNVRVSTVAAIVAAMLVRASAASADPILSLATEPAPAGDAGVVVEHAAVRGEHLLSIRVLFDIAERPLVVNNRFGEADNVVGSQFWFHTLATYALGARLAFHMDLPILLNQDEGDHPKSGVRAAPGPDGAAAFGDLRLGVRLSLLNRDARAQRHYDLAIGTSAWLPTGNDAYTSDGAVRGAVGLLVEGDSS